MNDQELRGAAASVMGRILGNAAFLFTDSLETGRLPDTTAWDCQGVSLEFSGEARGCFHLWAGSDFVRSAAANMLGIEEDAAGIAENGKDALHELLNMVVGSFLTDVYGDKPLFNLGIPQTLDRAALAQDCAENNAVWLQAEGKPLLLVPEIAK